MTPWEVVAILAAGLAAGAINAVVGSGSLITFPTMLALGYPPIVANVSNTVGLVAGGVTGVLGYREELKGQRERLLKLGAGSLLGSVVGGLLLLSLPAKAFQVIVPVLIALACVMVVLQPRVQAWLSARQDEPHPHGGPWLWLGVFAAGVYGGYFGAAQGVILIGLLGIFLDDHLQRVNAAKNLLSLVVNLTAAVLFLIVAEVDLWAALLVALGSLVGGFVGARVGRRLPPRVLRAVIVCVGIVAIVKLVYG
ncbi:sulfite exporter TauE/SafE family protein [Sphaerisporangium album]|uniref:Probable membrane transporter protein n=1 Tax=Sphaerisporangium album TaxID=509200 RepID=A0A367FL19_9ACTN|nr:sulfite exporter TauE/SafE family protein [Sphaerisporangium album]RCG30335.1 sulfite exporter TauE/SafE family protein [Sphaerisporangium album]